jgi:hypothetical protein
MERFDRITIELGKIADQLCIRSHRFTVKHLLTPGWGRRAGRWRIQADSPFIEAGDVP